MAYSREIQSEIALLVLVAHKPKDIGFLLLKEFISGFKQKISIDAILDVDNSRFGVQDCIIDTFFYSNFVGRLNSISYNVIESKVLITE